VFVAISDIVNHSCLHWGVHKLGRKVSFLINQLLTWYLLYLLYNYSKAKKIISVFLLICYLLPILYLPPMAGAPASRSGIAWDEHSHTLHY